MKNQNHYSKRNLLGLMLLVFACSALCGNQDRFQLEIYGGISHLGLKDLNLISRAEEEYNNFLLIERLLGYTGYFINDFPEISDVIPAGIRVRYRLSDAFSLAVNVERFQKNKDVSLSGTFSYSPSWTLAETKAYHPFHLGLKGLSVMGGVHYRVFSGSSTELEIGAAAGWTRAEFDYRSSWSFSIDFATEGFIHSSLDGGTLEGDGAGSGLAARGMLRLSQALGKSFGFFVETSASFCRLSSIKGKGRETRLGLPGETTWQGTWGIKKEEVKMSWGSTSISVPTNYWEGWVAEQRERDFVLDLSGGSLNLGIYLRF